MPDETEQRILLPTAFQMPAADADEVATLMFALDRARAQFAWKTGGLTTQELRRRHAPSTSSLGGLVKHLAQVEDVYVARYLTGEPVGPPWSAAGEEPVWEFAYRTADDDTAEELYSLWLRVVEKSRAAWTDALATTDLDGPTRVTTASGTSLKLRFALIDTIEEYQRHSGQADLIRESIDGLVGNDPPWSAES